MTELMNQLGTKVMADPELKPALYRNEKIKELYDTVECVILTAQGTIGILLTKKVISQHPLNINDVKEEVDYLRSVKAMIDRIKPQFQNLIKMK